MWFVCCWLFRVIQALRTIAFWLQVASVPGVPTGMQDRFMFEEWIVDLNGQ